MILWYLNRKKKILKLINDELDNMLCANIDASIQFSGFDIYSKSITDDYDRYNELKEIYERLAKILP